MTDLADWLRSDAALLVLINHQKRSIEGCTCGWSDLGMLHARHVADELIKLIPDRSVRLESSPL